MAPADRETRDDISSLPRFDFNVRARTHDPALNLASHSSLAAPNFPVSYTLSSLQETSSFDIP